MQNVFEEYVIEMLNIKALKSIDKHLQLKQT